jgi:transposase
LISKLNEAEWVGVANAAKQLGLHESQLYDWRKKARYEAGSSELEKELAAEKARLKRQVAERAEELAILNKAAAYFAKGLKYSTPLCKTLQAVSAPRSSVWPVGSREPVITDGGIARRIPASGSWLERNWMFWRPRLLPPARSAAVRRV